MQSPEEPLVSTIPERCRVCYTCVRECPAKAIRIADQQAEIVAPRCIGCGNCVRVCSQHAKRVASGFPAVRELLAGDRPVAICLAPSFPAEFGDLRHETVVGMCRELGFDRVHEVAVGADLVAAEYARLLRSNPGQSYIATTCPAVVGYVERYFPELVGRLAPIVSPMIATARALRKLHGDALRVVFVGPCIAKKGEAASDLVFGEIDAVLTFAELRAMLDEASIRPWEVQSSDFDPPHAGSGALFPISRGMLQAADIQEDLVRGEVVAAEGRSEFVEAIREYASGDLEVRLLELLACNGCIMGPGTTGTAPLFRRRSKVSEYVRSRLERIPQEERARDAAALAGVPLDRTFVPRDQRTGSPPDAAVEACLRRMGKYSPEDELNCGACGYETCRDHATAISEGLAESEMCLPFMIEQLGKTCKDLRVSNDRLASTQLALVQAEKLASMGQLAAGIAHEVNNPLSTVLMLSHILLEESDASAPDREDLSLIASEADRCKTIVSGLLQFARKNKVNATRVDLRELAYRTIRTLQLPDGVQARVEQEDVDTTAEVDRDQIVQVLSNLANNAVAALEGQGQITIRVGGDDDRATVSVIDTGRGIPDDDLKKIFEPFFTTKEAGQGTGLGLSVTYGIVKMHRGDIRIQSNADPDRGSTGTTFIIELPRHWAAAHPPAQAEAIASADPTEVDS